MISLLFYEHSYIKAVKTKEERMYFYLVQYLSINFQKTKKLQLTMVRNVTLRELCIIKDD